jgi:general secretion pathway protein I
VPRPSLPRHQRGFTLLEAIVAVAILGMAIMPLLAFISQSALELRLAGEANVRNLAYQNVLSFIETVNPMDIPNGEADIGTYHVNWTSQPAVPETFNSVVGFGLPGFRLGFYNMDVQVSRDRAPWFNFVARKMGYHTTQVDGMTP